MIAKVYLNDEVVYETATGRIRNDLNQGLLLTTIYYEVPSYVPPFSSSAYSLKYFYDDGTLVQSFSEVHFRSFSCYAASSNNPNTADLVFLVDRI